MSRQNSSQKISSPPATPKRKPSAKISFIQINNPEVLKAQPRAGGVIQIKPSTIQPVQKSSEQKPSEKPSEHANRLEEKVSREFRVQTALEDTGSINSEEVTEPHPLKDTMYLFGLTISSLILMASGHSKMSEEYASWTRKCLECVRDDFGNHPPNVQGILNHLRYLEESGKLKASGDAGETKEPEATAPEPEAKQEGDEAQDDSGEKTVVTTTRAKLGSVSSETAEQ